MKEIIWLKQSENEMNKPKIITIDISNLSRFLPWVAYNVKLPETMPSNGVCFKEHTKKND